jgi:hypothetical protein
METRRPRFNLARFEGLGEGADCGGKTNWIAETIGEG